MDNGIYVALSRQMTLFRDMEATASNIANVDTVGYNAQKLMFGQYLIDGRLEGERGTDITFTSDPRSYRDTRNGSMKTTGNPLDMAISGPGYFMVETPLGRRYSKAGNFQLDAEGTLVNPMGYPVLSQDGGTISLPPDAVDILVSDDGRVTADGDEVGQIGVVEFDNEQAMRRMGNNLYEANGQAPIERRTARVAQGVLEGSNVSGVSELVRTIQLQRSTANTAKLIETMYDLQRKTSNTYAKPAQG